MTDNLRPTWDDIAYHWDKWGPPLDVHFPAYELGDRCPIIIAHAREMTRDHP